MEERCASFRPYVEFHQTLSKNFMPFANSDKSPIPTTSLAKMVSFCIKKNRKELILSDNLSLRTGRMFLQFAINGYLFSYVQLQIFAGEIDMVCLVSISLIIIPLKKLE